MNDNKSIIRLNTMSRDDMHVKLILDKASSTALYSYEESNGQWIKDNVEGSLMLYEREAPPFFMMKIVNKLSKINFIEPLTPTCEIQVKPPYLLFKNSKGKIYGIWFNEEKDVHRISNIIKEKLESDNLSATQPTTNILNDPAVAAAGTAGGDIMTMLSLAHGEFESKRQEPTQVTTAPISAADLVKPSPLRATDSCSNTVADFFAKVGSGSASSGPFHSTSNVPLNATSTAPSPSVYPVLQKLFQGAAAIGGQASVMSPQGRSGASAPVAIKGSSAHPTSSPHASSLAGSAPMSLQELEGKLKENLQVSSPREDLHLQQRLNPLPKSASEGPFLLSPQVFTSSQLKEKDWQTNNELGHSSTADSDFVSNILAESKPLNENEHTASGQSNITPLTQEQLVQAFTTLLKQEDFVRQLHRAYVQALHQSLRGCR